MLSMGLSACINLALCVVIVTASSYALPPEGNFEYSIYGKRNC